MAEPITEEDIISEWTIAVEALDISSIQQLYDLRPNLLWTPLKNSSHLESDFDHFVQRLKDYELLGTSIRPVYALHHILFDYGLPGDEWINERVELVDFILKNTKGDELNTCFWGKEENTTMHLAILLNQPELIQQLLDKGASTSIPNKLGHLPSKEGDIIEESSSSEEEEEETKEDTSTTTTTPTLIISKKDKSPTKEKIPLNASDKFKRLRELAESPGNIKKTERQNSTRRYFRPGHLEERKRRVLSEEEEAELEKQRLLRQKDIALLAQRSAVKNNPLFKKFEEQQTQQPTTYKPNPIRSAASIMRDRRKLLNPADQIKRSSRVINSLKENSYVTSSIFRQQAAQTENTLPIPKLRSRAPSPISKDSTPNTSDTEEDIRQLDISKQHDAPMIVIEEASTPQTEGEASKLETKTETSMPQTTRDISTPKTAKEDSTPPTKLTKRDDKNEKYGRKAELEDKDKDNVSSVGKLKTQNLFGNKQTSKPNVNIATSKVKEIIDVHEHLNDEEEIEIYSTGKVFSVWKNEKKQEETEDQAIQEDSRIKSKEGDVESLKAAPLLEGSQSSDSIVPTASRSLLSNERDKTTKKVEQRVDTTEKEYSTVNVNKLKFGGFEGEESRDNGAHVNRLKFGMNEDDHEKSWAQANKLQMNKDDDYETEEDLQRKGLQLNGYQESSSGKDGATVKRLGTNHSMSDEEEDSFTHASKLKFDKESDTNTSKVNKLNIEQISFLSAESINKLDIDERGIVNAVENPKKLENYAHNALNKSPDTGKDSMDISKEYTSSRGIINDSRDINKSHMDDIDSINAEGGSLDTNSSHTNRLDLMNAEKDSLDTPKSHTDYIDSINAEGDAIYNNSSRMNNINTVDISNSHMNNKDSLNATEMSHLETNKHNQNINQFENDRFNLDDDDFMDDENFASANQSRATSRYGSDDSASDTSFEDASRGSKMSFNMDEYDSPKGKSKFDSLEFDDHIRFDDDEDVLGYQPPPLKNNERDNMSTEFRNNQRSNNYNMSTESLIDKDISDSKPFFYQDNNTNDHTQQHYNRYEPYNNAIPISAQTVVEEEYESDEEGAKTPTLANPNPADQNQWQSAFDKLHETSISNDANRYSTSSSVNETSILNTLHTQQKAQEDGITTRWSEGSERWYDPDESQRGRPSDDSSSRNSSNYSFKNSNSTEITRMDSSSDDDTFYKREQQHDVVIENEATIQQDDDEDEEYYSTALHQREQSDGYPDTQRQQDEYYNTQRAPQDSTQRSVIPQEQDNTRGIKVQHNNVSEISITVNEYKDDYYNSQEPRRDGTELYSVKSGENGFNSTQSFKTRESESISYGDGEIVVFMDSPSHHDLPRQNPLLLSPSQQNLQDDTRSLIRVPSQTNTIYAVGQDQDLEDMPHDPKNPRIEDISHYLKVLPSLRKNQEGMSAFDTDQDNVMVKRVKSTKEPQEMDPNVPTAHEFGLSDFSGGEVPISSMDVSGYGKMYIGVSGAHHVLLPLPKEITYVRIVISDGEYEYMSRYEILTQQILMDYECVIDTKPGMIITVSLHVRPDYHVRPKTGWSKWFTSIRKQKEHLSGYVYPEDGAIGQTRFAVDHMIPGCYKKTYQAYFDCFNSWYARTYQERARREKFGDEEDFLKIVGKLNIEMLYLPVSSPTVQVPRSLRECDLTLKICQWHETCWQSGYLSLRRQGTKVWERHYYRLIGSQLIGYTTEENGRTRQVYNHFNIADVIRLSAAADKVIVTLIEEDTSKVFTDTMHTESNEKGFFRLTFNDYYLDCVSDTMDESEEWVKTLKSMIGHVQRFHYILDGIKNIF